MSSYEIAEENEGIEMQNEQKIEIFFGTYIT